MNKENTLYIIEPHANGHRMAYVRRVAREAVKQGIVTTIVTFPACLEHPSFKLIEDELGDKVSTVCMHPSEFVYELTKGKNQVLRQLAYWKALADFFRKLTPNERPDRVFVPYLDDFDKPIAVLGSPFGNIPFGGLSMQYKFHYGRSGALRPQSRQDIAAEWTFKRLLKNKNLTTLFTIDELLIEDTCRNTNLPAKDKMVYVADPVDMNGRSSREDAREYFELPASSFVVLIFGGLALRKGIIELASAISNPNCPSAVTLLVVGQQNEEVRNFMRGAAAQELRAAGRLVELDSYVGDETEYMAFRASNAVWIGYKDFYGMSGVLIQAGHMGLPVITSTIGLVAYLARKYDLGIIVDISDTNEIVKAITTLIEDQNISNRFGTSGKSLALRHTGEAFAKNILQRI